MDFVGIIFYILAFLIAIIGHEIMHGYVAYRYGDSLAKSKGRLSINPLVHIDILGSIIVPAILFVSQAPFLFGWAKPVPIDGNVVYRNGGYNALSAVALAGITFNLLVAIIAALILNFFPLQWLNGWIVQFLAQLLLINVVLAVFNAWPIPPLDGSQVLSYQLSKMGWHTVPSFFNKIGMYGMVILMIILMFEPLRAFFFYPVKVIIAFLMF